MPPGRGYGIFRFRRGFRGRDGKGERKSIVGDAVWYHAEGTARAGPMTLEALLGKLPKLDGDRTLVFDPGCGTWTEARHVQAVADALRGGAAPPPPPRGRGKRGTAWQ